MKKYLSLLFVTILFNSINFAQLHKTSWDVGAGPAYARFMAISSPSHSHINNYGLWVAAERKVSEHIGFRLHSGFYHMESEYPNNEIQKLDLFSINGDVLYYLLPCEEFTPYVGVGMGAIFFESENSPEQQLDKADKEYQLNLIFGGEWKINSKWSLQVEFDYHTASTNRLDGSDDPASSKGILGGNADTYMTFDIGAKYYFGLGEKSKLCDIYDGLQYVPNEGLTKDDIRKIIKEYLPKEVIKEVVVERTPELQIKNWTLVGVNFEFNSSRLDNSSFSVLAPSVIMLKENSKIRVEIIGYSDNIGTEEYNKKLSLSRAQSVKNYLVSKGIDENRLEVTGAGKTNFVADNETTTGRFLNRRIEFRIIE